MKLSKKSFPKKRKWSLSQGFCAAPERFNLVVFQSDTPKLEDKSVHLRSP